MQKKLIVTACLAVMATSSTLLATPVSEVYKNRCANCHGDKADGLSKIASKQEDMKVSEMAGAGIASGPNLETHGIPLKNFSEEELLSKLKNLRKDESEIGVKHTVMRENLKTIEKREGKFSDEEMAAYIYSTFGEGAQK